ncbi:hypothetical protein Tco_0676056 [Tanacetum coccineum]
MVVITRSSTVISSTPQRFPAKLSNPVSSPQVSFSSSSVSVRGGRVGWNSNNKTMKTSVVASAAAAAGEVVAAEKLTDADALIDSVETFIFDCDDGCGDKKKFMGYKRKMIKTI